MKSFIVTILLTLAALTGQAQVKCHVVGTVADGVKRQTFYVAQQGTADDDDAKWTEVKVKDGRFALDIEAETTEMYEIIEDHKEGGHFALFLVENDTLHISITPDDEGARLDVVAGGPELQPGQPYFNDYEAVTADGEKVRVGTLYRGRVTLIIMWASWCNSCRGHAKLQIPLYEKYHDAGLNVVAIAREWNMNSFRLAMERDKYPWPSLVDYQDRFGVWEKHAKKNGSGKFLLIDRDGTILSTSFDAQELEPIIKKALNIE
jgi:thiol-disulfide isomerase/thioredoxin